MSYSLQSRNVRFSPGGARVRGSLGVPVKRRRAMTQAERDQLVALKKAKKKLITQKQAAEELASKLRIEKVHEWRPRRSRFGELVQWDTSDHDWLEGRGEEILLINMIDDATSQSVVVLLPPHQPEGVNRTFLLCANRTLSFCGDRLNFAHCIRSRTVVQSCGLSHSLRRCEWPSSSSSNRAVGLKKPIPEFYLPRTVSYERLPARERQV